MIDRFDRPDDTSPGAAWSEVSGDWSLAASTLELTTPSAGSGRIDLAMPFSAVPREATVSLRGTAPGEELGLHLFDNTVNCRAILGASAGLGSVVLGDLAYSGLDLVPDVFYRLRVCADESGLGGWRATVWLDGVYLFGVASGLVFPAGTTFGIVVANASGTPTFDEYRLGRLYRSVEETSCRTCAHCPWPGKTVSQVELVIPTNGEPCPSLTLAGTYALQRVAPSLTSVTSPGVVCSQFETNDDLPSPIVRLAVTVEETSLASAAYGPTVIRLHVFLGPSATCFAHRRFSSMDFGEPVELVRQFSHVPTGITVAALA
jgi:hypothetical protein